ncbi:lipolytic protein g-d-s-l family [Nannochloropsis gaditana CCMP526]|uniref:lipolytic protein g-d-s-l family n=1 Tax=Nannochloropsis gaditana (strain CCMP526) TaxID=1093141 RepID=UPI00029F6B5F|nr:lipolytic protein g-d-s-l family [Nannochloropsis gaditana CCMP526]EKU22416.1 lipolytic protein g-d-s-l family [Nannochloropsis gaditana CCMP526]|eukprot:XP_005853939.1 lipolytic protein g-d-s-l family [Nannochloropsis gaditana CCMP526]
MSRRLAATLFLLPALCLGRTVMIGDSMFSNNAVKNALEYYAGGNVTIENMALVGASLHEGWVPSIPAEYSIMSKNPPPITIVMDGGGNDVISVKDDCLSFNDRCQQQIKEATDILADLLERMHEDKVQHVLLMGPYYLENLNKAVDEGFKLLSNVCKNATIDCHIADTRDLDPPLGDDGIHPIQEGYELLATRIWEIKLDNDIPII